MDSDEEQIMNVLSECIKGYVETNHTTSQNYDASNLISLIESHSERALLEACRNKRNKFDQGLVHVAAIAGHIQVLKALFVKLSDDDYLELLLMQDINDETPAIIASGLGSLEILTILIGGLSEQSCFRLLQLADGTYGTAVHHAALNNHSQVLDYVLGVISKDLATQLFLQANAMGIVPLHWAAMKSCTESITTMLDIVGSPGHAILLGAEDKSGNTSLHHAACNLNSGVMGCIIKSISQNQMFQLVQIANQDDQTPLHLAATKGNVEVMRTIIDSLVSHPQFTGLLQAEDDANGTILHHASQCGSLHAVRCIVEALPEGVQRKLIKSTDAMGMTALHWAARSKQASVFEFIQTHLPNDEWVELLAMKDGGGESVMHTAANSQCDGILEKILGTVTNADWEMLLNLEEAGGKKPDALVCSACKDNIYVFKATVNSQAKIASVSSYAMFCTRFYDGKSLLHMACCNGSVRVVEYILECLPPDKHIEVLQQQNHSGHTALHFAIESSGHELVKLFSNLIPEDKFMQLLQCNGKVGTPLHVVARSNDVVIAKCLLNSVPMDMQFQMLSEHDRAEQTPLHSAICNANADMFDCIVVYCTQDECIHLLNAGDINSNNMLQCALKPAGDHVHAPYCGEPLSNSSRKVSLEVIQRIMNIIPSDERISYLMKVDRKGRTSLHLAAQYANPDVMAFLLGFVPADQRITAAELKDKQGQLLLHYAYLNEDTMMTKTVLDTIPTEEHVRLLLIEDTRGVAAIHLAFFNVDTMRSILETTVPAHCLLNLLQKQSWLTITNSDRYERQFDMMVLLKVFELFPEDLQFMILKLRDDDGMTILHCLCEPILLYEEQPIKNCMDYILQPYSFEQRIRLLLMQDKRDRICLHSLSSNNYISSQVYQDVMKLIQELVPADQHMQLLLVQDESGMTILHYLCEEDDGDDVLDGLFIRTNIGCVLQPLSSEQRIQVLLMRDEMDRTCMHYLSVNKGIYPQALPDVMKFILELVSADQRIQLVLAQDESGMTILHYLCKAGHDIRLVKKYIEDNIEYILQPLTSEQRIQLLLMKDNRDRTFMHCLYSNNVIYRQVSQDDIKQILEPVPADQRIQLLLAQDESGMTLLHCLCELSRYHQLEDEEEYINNCIDDILKLLSSEQRIQFLLMQDKRDRTFLHCLTTKRHVSSQDIQDVMELVQDLVPADQHMQLLLVQDESGMTILHRLCQPDDDGEAKKKDIMGAIEYILQPLTTEQRIQLLLVQDKRDRTFLHCLTSKRRVSPQDIQDVMELVQDLVPADQHMQLLLAQDESGMTILHCLCKTGHDIRLVKEYIKDIMGYILRHLPSEQRIQLLLVQDKRGVTILHCLCEFDGHGEVKKKYIMGTIEYILQPFTTEQRIQLLLVQDKRDRTFLHCLTSKRRVSSQDIQDVMELVQDLVPADQHMQLLLAQDESGMTILHCLCKTGHDIRFVKTILHRLCQPDDDGEAKKKIMGTIEYILQPLTTERRIQLLLVRDKRGRTFLHYKLLQEHIPAAGWGQSLVSRDGCLMTLLHHACDHIHHFGIAVECTHIKDSVDYVLRLLPAGQCIQILLLQDNVGRTCLHHLCGHMATCPQVCQEAMNHILNSVPADQLIKLLLIQDQNSKTILHYCSEIYNLIQTSVPIHSKYIVIVFLELIPAAQHHQILRVQDNRGRTCLHYLSDNHNPDLMTGVLMKVQSDDRIQLLVIQDVEKKTALHCVFEKIFTSGNIDVFMKFLHLVPAEQLTKLLHINDHNGNTIMHHCSVIDSSVQCLDRSAGTVPDYPLQDEWNRFVVYLVHLVPDDHLAQLLTLLHQVFLHNEGFVKRIFALIPEDSRLDTAMAVLASSNGDHQSTYPNGLSFESRSVQQSKSAESFSDWLILSSLQLSVQNNRSSILRKVIEMILVDDQACRLLLKPVGYGQTALQNAIGRNQTEQIQCIVNCLGNEKTFLIFKATRYLHNRTVLHQAALQDYTKLLKVLMDSITQKQQLSLLRVKDIDGLTAIDEAKASGSEGSMDILEEYLTDARVEEALTEGGNLVQEVVKDAPLTDSHIQKLSEKSRDYIIPRNHRKTKCFGLVLYNIKGRDGAIQEADTLVEALQATCSNVLRVEWIDALDVIRLIVENLEEIQLSDCCLLTVCIMSHGAPGILKGQRGRDEESSVPINDVLHALKWHLPGHLPMVVLIQACQPYRTYELPSTHKKKADANRTSAPGANNHVVLDRPHTALLLATVPGGYAIRGHFTGAMADQFLKADGKTDIHEMFTQAVSNVKTSQEGPMHQQPEFLKARQEGPMPQQPEFRSTLSKRLCLYSSRLKKVSSKKRKRESKGSSGISNNASTSSSAKQTKFCVIENKNKPGRVKLTEGT